MALCPNCGVDIDKARQCPLCRTIIKPDSAAADAAVAAAEDDEQPVSEFSLEGLTEQEYHGRQVVTSEIISVCMGIVAVSATVINLILARRLDWSLYILLSLAFSWIMVCVPLLLPKRSWLVWPILAAAPFGFLLGLDALLPPISWSLRIALPIVAAVELAGGLAMLATRLSRRHGLNIVAFGLLACTFVCLAIEAVVCLATDSPLRLVWSSIVAFTTVPVAGFLMYFHFRIARTSTLRKLFHL
ncbi:MAG: hypothetical protein KKI09_07520 [Spirochaetes bacterium]|nr:hypothetical protein [Spirochaetota bacterium]MBU0955261.1 hypothetical protein [Spirochaetota bacterium]